MFPIDRRTNSPSSQSPGNSPSIIKRFLIALRSGVLWRLCLSTSSSFYCPRDPECILKAVAVYNGLNIFSPSRSKIMMMMIQTSDNEEANYNRYFRPPLPNFPRKCVIAGGGVFFLFSP